MHLGAMSAPKTTGASASQAIIHGVECTSLPLSSGDAVAIAAMDISGQLAQLVQTLVADMNRLHDRVCKLEAEHGRKLTELAKGLDVLAANVQGFGTSEEVTKYEQRDRDLMHHHTRMTVVAAAEKLDEVCKHDDELAPGCPTASPKHTKPSITARKRWHWAYMKVRMRWIRLRVPMTKTKVGREHSLAVRLNQAEEKLDNVSYQIEVLLSEAGPQKLQTAISRVQRIELELESFSGRTEKCERGMLSRLMAVEVDVDAVKALTRKLEQRHEDLSLSLCNVQGQLEVANESAASAAQVASLLAASLENNATRSNDRIAYLRKRIAPLLTTLAECCLRASHDVAVCKRRKLGAKLRVIHTTVTEARSVEVQDDQWLKSVESMARFLHQIILEDRGTPSTEASLDDVRIEFPNANRLKASGMNDRDIAFVADLGAGCSTVRSFCEVCRRLLADALSLDEAAVCPGMLALHSWYSSPEGPGGLAITTRLAACDAGIVAAQAALHYKPHHAHFNRIAKRLDAVEEEAKLRGNSPSADDIAGAAALAKRATDELHIFKRSLDKTSHSVESLRDQLNAKAGYNEITDSLDALRGEILRLATTAVGRTQLESGLASKIDRKDMNRIAALIATGDLPGLHPAVAAKLQIPEYRCLSCDRRLPSQAVALSAMARHSALETTPECSHQSRNSIVDTFPADPKRRPKTADLSATHSAARGNDEDIVHSGYALMCLLSPSLLIFRNRATFSRYPRLMPATSASMLQPANRQNRM